MAAFKGIEVCKLLSPLSIPFLALRGIQTSPLLWKKHIRAGRYQATKTRDNPLTYEEAKAPYLIGIDKAWNSWNSSNLEGEGRKSETLVEDTFIRKFMTGTWHGYFASEIIIKRRHNLITIAGLIVMTEIPTKTYFLIGYTEELLSCLLKCPVKLELQTVSSQEDMIFKYI